MLMYSSCSAYAEQLPGYEPLNKSDNPILYKYLADYAIYLNSKLSVRMFNKRCINHIYFAVYDRNGKMVEEPTDEFYYLLLSKALRKKIKKLPPQPLPKEIECDYFILRYMFVQGENYKNKIMIASKDDEFNHFVILIIKKDNNIENITQEDVVIEDYDTVTDMLFNR